MILTSFNHLCCDYCSDLLLNNSFWCFTCFLEPYLNHWNFWIILIKSSIIDIILIIKQSYPSIDNFCLGEICKGLLFKADITYDDWILPSFFSTEPSVFTVTLNTSPSFTSGILIEDFGSLSSTYPIALPSSSKMNPIWFLSIF